MKQLYIFSILAFTIGAIGCSSNQNEKQKPSNFEYWEGRTMGTIYRVQLENTIDVSQKAIDSILLEINEAVSTYIPSSIISTFNDAEKGLEFERTPSLKNKQGRLEKYFLDNFISSQKIYKLSEGKFDPSCMPLVNFWGFGYEERVKKSSVDPSIITEMLAYVGLEKINYDTTQSKIHLLKQHPKIKLDFSAIAKGYAVDIILEYLKEKGIKNALVEIGGETRCIGKNSKATTWTIGINTPSEHSGIQDYEEIISLTNQAIASSGNYRNFYEYEGQKVSHEINPITGYPAFNDLLSASIIAADCATADALATAAMIMGLEDASNLIQSIPSCKALFITSDTSGNYIKHWVNK